MHEDQDPGGLLLLRLGIAGVETQPRLQLCQHGLADDRSHPVRLSTLGYLNVMENAIDMFVCLRVERKNEINSLGGIGMVGVRAGRQKQKTKKVNGKPNYLSIFFVRQKKIKELLFYLKIRHFCMGAFCTERKTFVTELVDM